ncbi:CcoQ/FixQ family Cbb3-type cytochrome c oxidase assembly chaperone [bacterium]|nr:CcoQ/FixQ family Cbb3-type cytochrome c oxidase assembly chaperone [bacterium]
MFHDYLTRSDLLIWPLIGLAIFFTVFVGVLVRVILSGRRPRTLADLTALPLADDERPHNRREVAR